MAPSDSGPLFGVPFGVKDCIHVAGIPTTAACEAFSFVPSETAPVVQALLDAGGLPLGIMLVNLCTDIACEALFDVFNYYSSSDTETQFLLCHVNIL